MTLQLPASDVRQLLPTADAMRAVGCESDSAFYRWCDKWSVTHYRARGTYARCDLQDGMNREAAKHEADKRRKARSKAAK